MYNNKKAKTNEIEGNHVIVKRVVFDKWKLDSKHKALEYSTTATYLLTVHVEAPLLDLHNASVNLTHVAAAIRFLQLPDPELPGSQVVVRYANAGIMCNYHRL